MRIGVANLFTGLVIGICLIALCPNVCLSELVTGYNVYANWYDLARLRSGVEAGLASSYDRSGSNGDFCQYESPTGLITEEMPAIVKTIQGPGMIYRFWMPHVMARRNFVVRMYFDGEATPRIDTDSTAIMNGTFSYFSEPLITTYAGGQVCYELIPFAQSLRIETVNKEIDPPWSNRHYYQYSYLTFPQGTPIDSYTGQLSSQEQQARNAAVLIFENAGTHPAGDSNTAESITTTQTSIPGGGSLAFALGGPGLIRKINVRMNDANDTELHGLNLQVYYDQASIPAIDVSVAEFFGAGKQRAAYKSIPIGTDPVDQNEGFYCYLPMPFRESVKVELYNTTDEPVNIDLLKVEYEPQQLDNDMCYLYAQKNSSIKQTGQIYHTILSTTGCGHYIGDLLYVEQDVNSFGMLEGDDVIIVDGNTTLNGTGLEDAYNGGAYYNWVAVQPDEPEGEYPQSATRPLCGILYVKPDVEISRADQYRWRIADCIPFSQSIEVNVENRYAVTGSPWTSVAFWYKYNCHSSDFDSDCDVDFSDFAFFATYWQQNNCQDSNQCNGTDFDNSGEVGIEDFVVFVENWL